MDYINYVKQSPMMGQIGLGGGAASLGRYASAAGPTGPRAVWGGGSTNAGNTAVIQYVTIASPGNASSFGTLFGGARRWLAGCSNGSRGLFGGGYNVNIISYITIASEANSQDFGDLTMTRYALGSCSSNTRGIFGGGDASGNKDTIDYVTIASTSNATDFGDMYDDIYSTTGTASNTRGIFGGGTSGGGDTYSTSMQYITIANTSNSQDFGDLNVGARIMGGVDNDTRACYAGGETASNTYTNRIDYVTIASTSNATDFGDLVNDKSGGMAGAADSDHGVTGIDRGVFGGGYTNTAPPWQNTIQYITISTTSNATDFGDLTNIANTLACVGGL